MRAAAPDALRDPHRVAAARRLLEEVSGPAAFDRLSGLAARLLGAGHVKVTLFLEGDVVVGGFGLPAGVVGGPAMLTGAFSARVVRTGSPLAVPDAARDERVAALPAVRDGRVRSYVGTPLVAASGHVVGVLAIYDDVPHPWTDDQLELLGELGASVVAELELSAAQSAVGTSLARLEVALEASDVGIWEYDLRTGALHWDRRCAAVFGLDGELHTDDLESVMRRHYHPDDRAAVREAMTVALDGSGEYLAEARAVRLDGAVRWTVSRGRVVVNSRGEPVRVLGTIVDVTDAREEAQRRLAAVQRAAAIAEVAAQLANAAHMAQVADVALQGAQVLGADASALAIFDHGGGPLRLHMTSRLVDAVHAGTDVQLPAGGVPIELDDQLPTQYVARHGEPILLRDRAEAVVRFPGMAAINELIDMHALAALPLRVQGRLLGSFVVVWSQDRTFDADEVEVLEALTAQIGLAVLRLESDADRAAAQAAMAEANRRLQLLAETGRVLSGTLEITQQIEQLADLVVPALADWCWIVVTDDQGRLHGLASAHRDPGRREELQRYVRAMVAVMTEDSGARVVQRTGRPVVVPEVDWAYLERVLPDPDARALLARMDLRSSAIVPLSERGQTLGVLGLFNGADRGPFSDAEVETAVEIGRRAGLSLRQARLYGQQRALADVLQRSMLSEPPEVPDCEIVVRYVPAAEGAEIGGDWYDVFVQPGGATVLAIGDVVGHDTRAAAAMGQVRGLLRGISYSSGGSPAEVLTELDRAVDGLVLDTMATALVARLERRDPRRDESRAASRLEPEQVLFRWASAGHPPPVVVSPDGAVRLLDGVPADLLLGVDPESHREDRSAVLEPGTTVLLYTDGLIERRDRDIDAGTAELLSVLRACAPLPLGELCDGVLQRMFLPDAEDDVAVLAVRLSP